MANDSNDPKVYKPRIVAGSVLNAGLLKAFDLATKHHAEEFTDAELRAVEGFKTKIGGLYLIEQYVSYSRGKLLDHELEELREKHPRTSTAEFEKLDFENWDDQRLRDRLYEAGDETTGETPFLRGRLPADDLQRLKDEIFKRETRKKEANPPSIRPPKPENEN